MTRPWRPSNNTMGDMWAAHYCEVCTNNVLGDCEILFNLMLGYDEHVTAEDGEMFGDCSEFVEIP